MNEQSIDVIERRNPLEPLLFVGVPFFVSWLFAPAIHATGYVTPFQFAILGLVSLAALRIARFLNTDTNQ